MAEENIEIYELLKPENTLPPNIAKIQAKYNEEVIVILEKSFKISKKYTLQSLNAMQNQHGAKLNLRRK